MVKPFFLMMWLTKQNPVTTSVFFVNPVHVHAECHTKPIIRFMHHDSRLKLPSTVYLVCLTKTVDDTLVLCSFWSFFCIDVRISFPLNILTKNEKN